MSEEQLEAVLKKISQNSWDANTAPALLSSLPHEIEKVSPGLDYKGALNGRSLKAFIKATQDHADYKLVEHPTTKARVGIMPASETYEFQDPKARQTTMPTVPKAANKKNAPNRAIGLFTILATLSDEDLEKVVIPASVIVKLLK